MPIEVHSVLESVDREIAFDRRRAGQVFFFGLLVEGLILTGHEGIRTPPAWSWQQAGLETLLFVAVAAMGIALGSEYRRRIHHLKSQRDAMLAKSGHEHVFPQKMDQRISEIQVLYVMLVFLSSAGIFIAWLNVYDYTWLLCLFFAWILAVVAFGGYWVYRCMKQ